MRTRISSSFMCVCSLVLQLCQDDSTNPSGAVSLGVVQNISWSVVNEDEFTLTITGGDSAAGPHRDRYMCVSSSLVPRSRPGPTSKWCTMCNCIMQTCEGSGPNGAPST